MATSTGWYVIGPLIAVGLVAFLGLLFWRMGLQQPDTLRDLYWDGLAIFGEPDDYGLLCPAVVTEDPAVAREVQQQLGDAGIRATHAVDPDGRMAVLVFAEEVEAARRVVNP